MDRKSIVLYGLAIAAALGNLCNLNVFFGVDFVFGSIFALIIVVLFGLRAGVISAFFAACFTVVHWEHFYAIPIFTLEIAVVGLLMGRNNKMPIIVADILFWLVIGLPSSYICYRYGLKASPDMVSLIVFKQALNGLFNASIAGMVIFAVQAYYDGKPVLNLKKPGIRHIVFTILTFGMLASCLMIVGIESRRNEDVRTTQVSDNLEMYSREIKEYLVQWHGESVNSVTEAAQKISDGVKSDPSSWLDEKGKLKSSYSNPQIQLLSESCRRGKLGFDAVYVGNAEGLTVAFYPIVNQKGQSTIGLDYSDRSYYKQVKDTLRPVVSEVFIARGGDPEPIITIAAPIICERRFIGYVTAAYKIGTMGNQLKMLQSDSNYSLNVLDTNSNVILSSQQTSDAAAIYTGADFDNKKAIDGSVQHFIPQDSRSAVSKYKDSWFLKSEKAGFSSWEIVVGYPAAIIQNELVDFVSTALMIIYFVLLVGCPVAMLLSNIIARPIIALTQINDAIKIIKSTRDVNSAQWPDSFIEEISQLSSELKNVVKDCLEHNDSRSDDNPARK